VMDKREAFQLQENIEMLGSISSRLRAGERLRTREVEQALERGFGLLMTFEADLQRALNASAEAGEPGTSEVEALRGAITKLRRPLIDLRTLSSPDGQSKVGYGFVLPREWMQAYSL
jgi:hypothetical protein